MQCMRSWCCFKSPAIRLQREHKPLMQAFSGNRHRKRTSKQRTSIPGHSIKLEQMPTLTPGSPLLYASLVDVWLKPLASAVCFGQTHPRSVASRLVGSDPLGPERREAGSKRPQAPRGHVFGRSEKVVWEVFSS